MLEVAALDLALELFLEVAVIVHHLVLLVQLVAVAAQVGTVVAVLPADLVVVVTTDKVAVLVQQVRATQADLPQALGRARVVAEQVHQVHQLMLGLEETEQLVQLLEQV
jgi:hypothetical protein